MNKGLTQQEKLIFMKKIETQTNEELTSIYLNQQDYRPEFIDLVAEELKKRESISDTPIDDINKILDFIKINIEETREKRESNVIDALEYGIDLWNKTGPYIFKLDNAIVFLDNIECQNVINELVLEILICSITAWNYFMEKEINDLTFYEDALELIRKAQSISFPGDIYDKICIEIQTMEDVVNKLRNSDSGNTHFDTSNTKNTVISVWNIFAIGTWIVAFFGLFKACS